MKLNHPMGLSGLLALASLPSVAAELQLRVELPRMTVAEYHAPYLAVWLQPVGATQAAGQLALWYDLKKRDNGGAKWLRDLRQWWRQGGRDLQTPADGVSGATRTAGEHQLNLSNAKALASLPAGQYEVLVEAVREGGGRELQRLPLTWPPQAAKQVQVQGEHELGAVSLSVQP